MFSTAYADLIRLAQAIQEGRYCFVRSIRIPLALTPNVDVSLFGGRIVRDNTHVFFRRLFPRELHARARFFGRKAAPSLAADGKRSLILTRTQLVAAIPLLDEAGAKLCRHGKIFHEATVASR